MNITSRIVIQIPSYRVLLAILMALALGGLAVTPSLGLINPSYTPVELVQDSERIILVTVAPPKDNVIEATVVETVVGEPLADKTLSFRLDSANRTITDDLIKSVMLAEASAPAVFLVKKLDPDAPPSPDMAVGALQINVKWFSVYSQDGNYHLDDDKEEISAVWAGSAPLLARAAKYVMSDLSANFPVTAELTWTRDVNLGKLAGKAHSLLAADFGGALGMCAVVLADGGDRLIKAGIGNTPPTDITTQAKLTTSSKTGATGDFNADGRIDLALWDGKQLHLALQTQDGTFEIHTQKVELSECLSLGAFDAGSARGAGLVAGTPTGPVVLIPQGEKAYAARSLATDAVKAIGPSGVFVVADMNNDGRADVFQVGKGGVALYAGQGGGAFAAPTVTPVPMAHVPTVFTVGDYDGDGFLDVMVGSHAGMTLLARDDKGRWQNHTYITGELAYHGNQGEPKFAALSPADFNLDGRQGLAAFYPDRNPMFFFNRGFACFGYAWSLDPTKQAPGETSAAKTEPPQGFLTLGSGQQAGIVMDANGDAMPDFLTVNNQGELWAILGQTSRDASVVLVVGLEAKQIESVTMVVNTGRRNLGAYSVGPGQPVTIGSRRKGPITLEWKDAGGNPQSKKVVLMKNMRVDLVP